MTDPSRRTALAAALVGAVGFAVLAWWGVPWSPVPGGAPASAPADAVLSAAEIARAEDFSQWARVWSWSSLALSLAVACWLGFTRAGTALVERLRGPWPVVALLAVTACALIGRLATLPFAVALQRLRREVGLSEQDWGGWLLDVVVGEGVSLVATALVVVGVVGCARRWPRRWPAVAAAVVGTLVMVGSFVYPVLVEPLSNDFRPLAEGELRSEILAVAAREDVAIDDVLVSDASRRTTTYNAYVSGYGATRRVVLYDTLVEQVGPDEVLSVVAHELAHARHDDVLLGSALGACGAAAGVGLLAWVLGRRRAGGAAAPGNPAVVPRMLALVAVATLVASPVQSMISRQVETRADVESLAATGDPQSFVELQRQLAVRSLSDPTPPAWSQFWFGSHPTLLERVALARSARGSAVGGGHLLVDRAAGSSQQSVDTTAEDEQHGEDDESDPDDQEAVLDG